MEILEELLFKEVGMKMMMYGHPITILNGQLKYVILITFS